MMAKSKILKQLANNEIDIVVTLSRLMIISNDIGNDDLYEWSKNELNGYNLSDKIPSYRLLDVGQITYSGIKGMIQLKHNPIPITAFSPEERSLIANTTITQSVNAIQKLADPTNKEKVGRDLTFLAESFYKRQGIQCYSIYMNYGYSDFENILGQIRTKLLSVFIKLDKEFGCLDDLDVDVSLIESNRLENIKETLNATIYSDDKAEFL